MTHRRRLRFNRGIRVAGRPASLASFGRWPYGCGGGPRTAPPVTDRLRSPPYPTAAPASTAARPSALRQMRRSPGRCHSHRAGAPRIIRVGPSSVKGTRRSFPTASQKRSSGPTLERWSLYRPRGPDGEGQARGQARSTRGEPPQLERKPEARRGGAVSSSGQNCEGDGQAVIVINLPVRWINHRSR